MSWPRSAPAQNALLERYATRRFAAWGWLRTERAREQARRIVERFDVRGGGAQAVETGGGRLGLAERFEQRLAPRDQRALGRLAHRAETADDDHADVEDGVEKGKALRGDEARPVGEERAGRAREREAALITFMVTPLAYR